MMNLVDKEWMDAPLGPREPIAQDCEIQAVTYQIRKHVTLQWYVGKQEGRICDIVAHFNREEDAQEYCTLKSTIARQQAIINRHTEQISQDSEIQPKKYSYVHSRECRGLSTDSECSCGVRQVEIPQDSEIQSSMQEQVPIPEQMERLHTCIRGLEEIIDEQAETIARLEEQIKAKDEQLEAIRITLSKAVWCPALNTARTLIQQALKGSD